jgi:uncharacterized protein (DUF433 family)
MLTLVAEYQGLEIDDIRACLLYRFYTAPLKVPGLAGVH